MDTVLGILGKTFTGTLIEDDVLEPYFILNTGGYIVCKKRLGKDGQLKYSDICYPSSFERCLHIIAKKQLNEEGKSYESIQKYVDTWKEISNKILQAHKSWNVTEI